MSDDWSADEYATFGNKPPRKGAGMSDIVERLRAAKDPSVMLPTHPPQFRTDALCAEAAAEIERLRAALEGIIILSDDYHQAVPIARAALSPKPVPETSREPTENR